jgi:hypothetical protein
MGSAIGPSNRSVSPSRMSSAIPPISPPVPFRVSFPDGEIARLNRRLEDTRFPSRLVPQDPKHHQDSGDRTLWPTPEYLTKAVEAWKKFDIRKMEAELNRYVQSSCWSLISDEFPQVPPFHHGDRLVQTFAFCPCAIS